VVFFLLSQSPEARQTLLNITGTFELNQDQTTLTVTQGNVILSNTTFGSLTTISFSQAGTSQGLELNNTVLIPNLSAITGTTTNNTPDDGIFVFGTRDFSGVTFTNISFVDVPNFGGSDTLGVNSSTDFGGAGIVNFQAGSGSFADVFDYKSDLKAGNGNTSINEAVDTLTLNTPSASATAISNNASAVIKFANAQLSVDLLNSTADQIVSNVESLLESTSSNQITQSNSAVTQGAELTDSLLIFFEATSNFGTTRDAVVIRYQEGAGTPDASFDDELSVLAVFQGVTDFDVANIV